MTRVGRRVSGRVRIEPGGVGIWRAVPVYIGRLQLRVHTSPRAPHAWRDEKRVQLWREAAEPLRRPRPGPSWNAQTRETKNEQKNRMDATAARPRSAISLTLTLRVYRTESDGSYGLRYLAARGRGRPGTPRPAARTARRAASYFTLVISDLTGRDVRTIWPYLAGIRKPDPIPRPRDGVRPGPVGEYFRPSRRVRPVSHLLRMMKLHHKC